MSTRYRGIRFGYGDRNTTDNYGGLLLWAIANQTLKFGEIVGWINSANRVDKSATAATVGNVFAGVVVGGDLTNYKDATQLISNTTTNVASSGKEVLIMFEGICKVAAGAAIATIGGRLIGDTTAGRVIAGTTAGAVVGVNIEAASGADTLVKMFIMRR
jgi:hypothetical protein